MNIELSIKDLDELIIAIYRLKVREQSRKNYERCEYLGSLLKRLADNQRSLYGVA